MRTNRIIACASLSLALAAGVVLSRPARGGDDDTAGVTKQCQAFKAAWNKHDAKALAGVFAEDGDHIDPFGKLDSGRIEVEKMLTGAITGAGMFHESTLVVNTEVVRFPTADTAITDAEATISGATAPDGSKAPPMEVHVTNVWKKTDGTWLVYACRPYLKPAPPPAK